MVRAWGLMLGLVVALLVGVPACGEEYEPGYTACGSRGGVAQVCQPGEHCVEPETGTCETGCLSDDNCGEGQRCALAYGLLLPGYCSSDYELDDDD